MHAQLKDMLIRQNAFNNQISPEWVSMGFEWHRAVWTECAELMDHMNWKWWSNKAGDTWQAQLEVVDIYCFLQSWVMDEQRGDMNATLNTLLSGLAKPAVSGRDFHATVELFAQHTLATRQPSLPLFRSVMDAAGLTVGGLHARLIGKMTLNKFRQDNGYRTGGYQKDWAGREDNAHLQDVVCSLPEAGAEDLDLIIYRRLDNLYRECLSAGEIQPSAAPLPRCARQAQGGALLSAEAGA